MVTPRTIRTNVSVLTAGVSNSNLTDSCRSIAAEGRGPAGLAFLVGFNHVCGKQAMVQALHRYSK